MNTINEEQKVKIIICKVCGLNNNETKFQKRKTCIKCNSKRCNEKILMKDPSYFNNKVKSRYVPHGKVGRPKLIIELN